MTCLTIDQSLCNKDGLCIQACPIGLIEMGADGVVRETAEAAATCIRCGHCAAICPTKALTVNSLAAEDFRPAPKRDAVSLEDAETLLLSRRSIREFKPDMIPQDTFERLFDIVRYAPTASNAQAVRWMVTADPARTRALARSAMDWMVASFPGATRYKKMLEAEHDVVLRGAPHVAIALMPEDTPWGYTDCAIAVTYMDLAAHPLGLGACWAGLLMRAAVLHPPLIEMLELPQGYAVRGALMLGYPKYRYRAIPPRNAAHVTWL